MSVSSLRDALPTSQLYGGVIAVVSGGYSMYLSTRGTGMSSSAWFMLALGAIVFVHGFVLFTSLAHRLRGSSGPLMIVYASLMLLNQAWMAAMPLSSMGSGMGDGMGNAMAASIGWDAGMVAIAVLMLVSGAIMTARKEMAAPMVG